MKNDSFLISFIIPFLFLIILSLCTCKKKSSPLTDGEKAFLGQWELVELKINGRDTTSFVKADSNCYGYTLIDFDQALDRDVIQQVPFYNGGTNFHCGQSGHWAYYGPLEIYYFGGGVNFDPYLAGERLYWQVLEITQNKLRLFINYHNMPCYLTYKK